MSAPPGHVHVSEQQPGLDFDCVWMSYIEFVRQVHDRTIPATHAEGDALRAETGDTGTSNLGLARQGSVARYGYNPPASVEGFPALWAALKPGYAAIVTGRLSGWPVGHHFRRWYPTYTGGHACSAYRPDAADSVWWCDPGGPPTGYSGEPMSKADLALFVNALPDAPSISAPVLEDTMAIYQRRETPGIFTIRAGVEVHGYRAKADGTGWEVAKTRPKAAVVSLPASFDATLGRLSGTTLPSSLLVISTGYFAGLFVSTAEVEETVNPAPLDATPYSQAQLDEAKGEAAKAGYNQGRLAVINAANAVAVK